MSANEKRMIDAYKLEDLLRSNCARYHCKDDVIAAIAKQPTVDAVEVVRCKDCDKSERSPLFGSGWRFCKNNKQHHKDEHFCSYGERRKDG